MSLLNDMLRDLDRNQRDHEVEPMPSIKSQERMRTLGKGWWLPALAALVVGYWLVVDKSYLGLLSGPPVAHSEALAPVNIDLQSPEDVAREVTAGVAEGVTEGVAEKSTQKAVADQWVPNQPVSDQQVPDQLETAAPVASQAEQAAVSQPEQTDSISTAIPMASTPVSKPLVKPEVKAPDQARAGQGEGASPPSAAPELAAASPVPERPGTNAGIDDQIQKTSITAAATPIAAETKGAAPAASSPKQATSQVSLSAEERDFAVARSLSQRHLAHGEAQAWQWLKDGAVIDLTVLALADAYRALGDINKLEELEQNISGRAPNLGAYVLAQKALLEGNRSGASEALRNVRLPGRAESQRLRLLGGVYQSTQQYPQAREVYQVLVSRRDAQANDWLGLAVALDSLGQRSDARDAYRNVQHLQHPDPQINAYAQRREYELSQSFLGR